MKLIVNILESSCFNNLTDLLPTITVNLLPLYYSLFLLEAIRLFRPLYFFWLIPSSKKLNYIWIIFCFGELSKVDLFRIIRKIWEIDSFDLLFSFLIIEFIIIFLLFHAFEVEIVDYSELLFEVEGEIPFEFEVTDEAGGDWMIISKFEGCDILFKGFHAILNDIPWF